MSSFWNTMDKISFGMLAQGGYFQADTFAVISKKLAAERVGDTQDEKTVSYRSTPSLHQEPFRVCA